MTWYVWLLLGFSAGGVAAWGYFRWCRLIRTKHEWYSDRVIRARYPAEAEEALRKPDTW